MDVDIFQNVPMEILSELVKFCFAGIKLSTGRHGILMNFHSRVAILKIKVCSRILHCMGRT